MADPNAPALAGSLTSDVTENAAKAAHIVRSDADAALGEVKDAAGKIATEARDQISQVADEAREQISQQTENLKGMAGEQKDLLATHVDGIADALKRVASDLETNNGPGAPYARMISDGATRLSSTIRDNDVDALLGMAQDFGRKQPAAFVGVAAAMGFAASRFLFASAARTGQRSATAQDTTAASGGGSSISPNTAGGSNGTF